MIDRTTEERLDITDIQGDILVGLQKKAETFVGFTILDIPRFRAFLSGIHLTSARDAIVAQRRIDAYKANGGSGLLDIRGINVAFSIDGLRKLGAPGLDQIADTAFTAGLAARSTALGDPTSGDGAAPNWRVGNGDGQLDGLLLITGRGPLEVAATMADLDAAAGQGTWLPFYVETGAVRPGAAADHEHFGFLDGVSQPSIRGRIDDIFPDTPFLNPTRSSDPNQGLPGSDLHWPGEFVFGYAEQSNTDVEKFLGPKQGGPAWMKNGSFMVFRRLEQLVPEFHAITAALATKTLSQATIEARLVGRHPHGAPLIGNPNGDDPVLGADALRNNDFDFHPSDDAGAVCPYAAHIRKAYPRNDVTPAGAGATGEQRHTLSEADTQTHRIVRRGIPFGREVSPGEAAAKRTTQSRGLMFVCYQTAITDQFEFITRNWVNNPGFAVTDAGHDIILGQTNQGQTNQGQNNPRARFITGLVPGTTSGQPPRTIVDHDVVRPTGGGYFFMPAISTVHSLLAATHATATHVAAADPTPPSDAPVETRTPVLV